MCHCPGGEDKKPWSRIFFLLEIICKVWWMSGDTSFYIWATATWDILESLANIRTSPTVTVSLVCLPDSHAGFFVKRIICQTFTVKITSVEESVSTKISNRKNIFLLTTSHLDYTHTHTCILIQWDSHILGIFFFFASDKENCSIKSLQPSC